MNFSSSLPPLLAAALLLCAWCAEAADSCPNCGPTPVPYPLSTGPTCGHPSYRIRCDAASGGALWFDTLNNTYPIAAVHPESRRLVLRPAAFSGNACVTADISSRGVQLDPARPFNITSANTIFYLNCTESVLESPLDCSPQSLCHSYAKATPEAAACADAPICCTFRTGGSVTEYSIRVRPTGCRAYRSFVNLDRSKPVSKWGDPGLEIQWFPVADGSPVEGVGGSNSA